MIDLCSINLDGHFAVVRRGVIDGSKDLGTLLVLKPYNSSSSRRYFQYLDQRAILVFSEEKQTLKNTDSRLSEYEIDSRNGLYRRVSFYCATNNEEDTARIVCDISNHIGFRGQKHDIKPRLMEYEFFMSLTGGNLASVIAAHSNYIVQEELKALGIIV